LHWREHSLAIGARVTHATLLRDERVAATFPWLTQAVRALGDVQVRQRGTTVGNVCWADPRANMLVALSASDAVVVLQAPGRSGLQRMPIADFITGFRQTAAGAGIVLAIDDNLVPDHRTAVELMDGNPNVLRLLVRERTMSEAELEGAIKRLRVAARTASVGVCDVQLALDVCAADGTAATSKHT
jgi:CO/xanthine dehydrogenase FAD-binding subunit